MSGISTGLIEKQISDVLGEGTTNLKPGESFSDADLNDFFQKQKVDSTDLEYKTPAELLTTYFSKIKSTTTVPTPPTFEDYKQLFENKKTQEKKLQCVNFDFPSFFKGDSEEILKASTQGIFTLLKNDKNAVFISNYLNDVATKNKFITELNTCFDSMGLEDKTDLLSRIVFFDNSDADNGKRIEVVINTKDNTLEIKDTTSATKYPHKDVFSIAQELKTKNSKLKPIVNTNDLTAISKTNFNNNLESIVLSRPGVYAKALVEADKLNTTIHKTEPNSVKYEDNLNFLTEKFKELKKLYSGNYENFFKNDDKQFLQKIKLELTKQNPSPTMPVPPTNSLLQALINDPNNLLLDRITRLFENCTKNLNLSDTTSKNWQTDVQKYFDDDQSDDQLITDLTKDWTFLSLTEDVTNASSIQSSFCASLKKIKTLYQTAMDRIIPDHVQNTETQLKNACQAVDQFEDNLYTFITENIAENIAENINDDTELQKAIASLGAWERIKNYYTTGEGKNTTREPLMKNFHKQHNKEISDTESAVDQYLNQKITSWEMATDPVKKKELADKLKEISEQILKSQPLPSSKYQKQLQDLNNGLLTELKPESKPEPGTELEGGALSALHGRKIKVL